MLIVLRCLLGSLPGTEGVASQDELEEWLHNRYGARDDDGAALDTAKFRD